MFKHIVTGALTLLSCVAHESENTLNVTPEQGAQLACYIIADDFVVFDLTPLQKKNGEDYDYYVEAK